MLLKHNNSTVLTLLTSSSAIAEQVSLLTCYRQVLHCGAMCRYTRLADNE